MTPESGLQISSIASLTPEQRREFLAALTDQEAETLLYDWPFWARPKQRMPSGEWTGWLLMQGRGAGKTRTGAESVRLMVESGQWGRIALVAPTAADARDVMVEGESGLLAISPPWFRPNYEPSKRRVTWPNGAIATTFSADEPDRLRGPQHDGAWIDEPRSWRYGVEAFDMLMFGLRLGQSPRWIGTTTPSRTALIRKLLTWPGVVVSSESTYANRDNLAPSFFDAIAAQYEGTRLGRQELYAEMLDDVPGALWNQALIERTRIAAKDLPQLRRIVVAVDPAITSSEGANETGLGVAGVDYAGHGYVLSDLSLRASPDGWASAAVKAYYAWQADRIVAESNQGGEMVELTIRTADRNVPVKLVHASRGKITRAEPVAALYEQGKVHHVGMFAELEDQLCSKVPGDDNVADDRYDWLVWALTELMLGEDYGKPTSTSYA